MKLSTEVKGKSQNQNAALLPILLGTSAVSIWKCKESVKNQSVGAVWYVHIVQSQYTNARKSMFEVQGKSQASEPHTYQCTMKDE